MTVIVCRPRMSGRRGQALVEFALVMPVALLLLCGVTDFGRYIVAHAECSALCHDAARFASQINPETGEARTAASVVERVRSSPPQGVATADLVVTVNMDRVVDGFDAVEVGVEFDVLPLTAVAETFFPNGRMHVHSSGVFIKQ